MGGGGGGGGLSELHVLKSLSESICICFRSREGGSGGQDSVSAEDDEDIDREANF